MANTNEIQVGDKLKDTKSSASNTFEVIGKREEESFMSEGTKTYFEVKTEDGKEKEELSDRFEDERWEVE